MISRPVAIALVATGCLAAAAAGSYVAGRQSTAPAPATSIESTAGEPATGKPVTETEAVVEPTVERPAGPVAPAVPPLERSAPARPAPAATRPAASATRRADPAVARRSPPTQAVAATQDRSSNAREAAPAVAANLPAASGAASAPIPTESDRTEAPAQPSVPRFEEVVLPASSVIGLEIETALSSESARVEDRVDARVTRDVFADGRLAIPSGSRVVGAVSLVERGGKIKERARLGVRFHTLVLADGRQVDLRTDTIYREGESVSAESSKKIGGAAIGGAVLGAIMGGGKGALFGGAAGAAGGTAVVMAGGRNPATLPAGTVVTARVTNPVSIEIEKR